jgi:hypothetical protein
MTDQTTKFFFMASISVIDQGRLVTRFNTISSLNNLNITAAVLDMIQQGAASMVNAQEVDFTDLVVENVFCLTPNGCTEEEFVRGTQLAEQLVEPTTETISAESDLSELNSETVETIPVDDVATADVAPQE